MASFNKAENKQPPVVIQYVDRRLNRCTSDSITTMEEVILFLCTSQGSVLSLTLTWDNGLPTTQLLHFACYPQITVGLKVLVNYAPGIRCVFYWNGEYICEHEYTYDEFLCLGPSGVMALITKEFKERF